jgi:hypothetical protein
MLCASDPLSFGGPFLLRQEAATEEHHMPDNLSKKRQPDRSKINMNEDYEVRYWAQHLGVSKEELQKAVDKVGNSAAAVRKQLRKS